MVVRNHTLSIEAVATQVTWDEVQNASQAYNDNVWFQALGLREQQVVCFFDVVDPMSNNGGEEKTVDISQSIDRCSMQTSRVSCLTTGSKHWLRRRQRLLIGIERLGLQGILFSRHPSVVRQLSESTARHLSGNAVNHFNLVQGLVAAFAALPARFFMA